jgi:hypothetical protein
VNRDVFYTVWRMGGPSPTVQHRFVGDAEREAERLARQNPGATFTVMESYKSCSVDDPLKWVKHEDEVPF